MKFHTICAATMPTFVGIEASKLAGIEPMIIRSLTLAYYTPLCYGPLRLSGLNHLLHNGKTAQDKKSSK